jgi:hypothetical protein
MEKCPNKRLNTKNLDFKNKQSVECFEDEESSHTFTCNTFIYNDTHGCYNTENDNKIEEEFKPRGSEVKVFTTKNFFVN